MGYSEAEKSDKEDERQPVRFSVCSRHWPLFADDERALLGDSDHCILCHPAENDSLGG